MLKLAVRNVVRQTARSAMILAAVTFGTAGLILIGGFVQDMFVQLADATIHSQTGHIQIARSGYFGAGSRSPEKYLLPDLAETQRRVERFAGVRSAMARMRFSGLLNNGRTDFAIAGEGIEPAKEAKLGTFLVITQGRNLRDEDAYGILLGEGVAASLRLRPADRVNLLVSTPDGAMNLLEFQVVGVFQSFSRDYDARTAKIPIAAAQELIGTKSANVIVVELGRTPDTLPVARAIASDAALSGLDVKRWDEVDDFYSKAVVLYERQFGVLRLIVLILVLLSVSNVVNMSVLERAGEFGTMRALGNRNLRVWLTIMTEGIVLGLVGAALGTLAGIGLGWAISSVGIQMPPPPNSNMDYVARIQLLPTVIAGAMAVGLLATVAASVWPALRVSRMPIVEALRRLV